LLFILDTSLGNAYILYKTYIVSSKQKRVMSRIEFYYAVANSLCDTKVCPRQTAASFNLGDRGLHFSTRHSKLHAKCVICGKKII